MGSEEWGVETGGGMQSPEKKEYAMSANMLADRTRAFARNVVLLCRDLPSSREGRLIGDQLFRCGTSVGANYRAACRARSRADFVSKMGIVEEEADESLFWFELLSDLAIHRSSRLTVLMVEADRILAMVVSSIRTARVTRK
jgi:four helix bundle protein